jgi:hypothetical protein
MLSHQLPSVEKVVYTIPGNGLTVALKAVWAMLHHRQHHTTCAFHLMLMLMVVKHCPASSYRPRDTVAPC